MRDGYRFLAWCAVGPGCLWWGAPVCPQVMLSDQISDTGLMAHHEPFTDEAAAWGSQCLGVIEGRV